MNLVILYGIVVTNVDFKFIYDRFCIDKGHNEKYNHISVASCKLKLLNESVIEFYGYDDVADLMMRKLNNENRIIIEGSLDNNGNIKINGFVIWLMLGQYNMQKLSSS